MVKDMQDWEVELNKVTGMLKVRLEMLKESGLTYMPKSSSTILETSDSGLSSLQKFFDKL